VVMHDFVFDKILLSDARSNASIDSLLADVVVLKVMKPLIEQNLIVFEPPFIAACSHCLAEVDSQISSITEQMYSKFRDSMKAGRSKDGRTFIDSGPLYNPPLYFYPGTTRGSPIRQLVEQCVRAAILDVASAANTGGAIFSNSPIGMAAVLASEGRFSGPQGMRALSAQRAGSLPWVRGLSITQTLELRREAKQALPQLREFLARNLGAIDLTSGGQGTTEAHYIAELREQSEAVKAELQLVTSKRSRLAKNSLGIGILGISALGLATDKIDLSTAALALFGALSSLRATNSSHEEHAARQKSRPGYVLVAAETILQHAHQ